jgi:DNA polymerase-3 subunit epsilon
MSRSTLSGAPGSRPGDVQAALDDLEPLLADTTFVVVDLETTGGSPADCGITEVGAVKVRGGQVLGEFHSLVNPGAPIPPFVAVLTGITDGMVATAPCEAEVVPAFLEFARGAVLVAHNARFDTGFLKAACERLGLRWPAPAVLDTVLLARQVLTRDEAPNVKLSTLSAVFRTSTRPEHRALADARATVGVLHGLLERVGNRGVHTLGDLVEWQHQVTPAQRAKRHLADRLPASPGVYAFTDGRGRVLYVGTSRNIRSRVRTYFTAAETRRRMAEMVAIADEVEAVPCTTSIEASVRELRLIHAHRPPYNRRSKFPEREVWLKVTIEAFPRLSVVADVKPDDTVYLGPFPGRRSAQAAADAIYRALPLRQCTERLSSRRTRSACMLLELGRCGGPCEGREGPLEYGRHVERLRDAVGGDPAELLDAAAAHMRRLADDERFEEARSERERSTHLLRALARTQRLGAFTRLAEVVAARRAADGGWELVVVRHGRLAAAGVSPPRVHPRRTLAVLQATAETVAAPPPPRAAGSTEEAHVLLRWLEQPGTRLVEVSEPWSLPSRSALSRVEQHVAARLDLEGHGLEVVPGLTA